MDLLSFCRFVSNLLWSSGHLTSLTDIVSFFSVPIILLLRVVQQVGAEREAGNGNDAGVISSIGKYF